MNKLISLILLCLLLNISLLNAQNKTGLNLNAGIPITISPGFGFGKYFIDFSIDKEFTKNLYYGFGINYTCIDTKPSVNIFTFDRNILNSFLLLGNKFCSKNDKFNFSPQIRFGYSFYNYSLNEFKTNKQYDNGFFLASGITLNYKIYNKLFVNTGLSYNIIFNSFNYNFDFAYPAIYITIKDRFISNFNVGLGITVKI